jgi:hypothetical protein
MIVHEESAYEARCKALGIEPLLEVSCPFDKELEPWVAGKYGEAMYAAAVLGDHWVAWECAMELGIGLAWHLTSQWNEHVHCEACHRVAEELREIEEARL